MFVNKIDASFFSKTRETLRRICKGSPSSCGELDVIRNNFSATILPIDEEGTQSLVGLLTFRKNSTIKLVYKISRDCDNIIAHEYEVLRKVDVLARKVPHFGRIYGLIMVDGPLEVKSVVDAFSTEKRELCRPVLLTEYIHNWGTLYDYMENCTELEALSLIAQVLISIRELRSLRIAHNDLHCGNVLVRKCKPDYILSYSIDGREERIPSFGVVATIIDFGHGRCEPDAETALLGSLEFSHYGLYCDAFSPSIDYVRFISAIRHESKDRFNRIYNWCNSMLSGVVHIKKDSGWDSFYKNSGTTEVCKVFYTRYRYGILQTKLMETLTWIHSIQLLITRPIQNIESRDITLIEPFLKNWREFEKGISAQQELNYVFKILVLAVKMWRTEILAGDNDAPAKVEQTFLEQYNKLIKFYCPNVDYEEISLSLLASAGVIETLYYDHFEKLNKYRPARTGPLFSKSKIDNIVWDNFKLKFRNQLYIH